MKALMTICILFCLAIILCGFLCATGQGDIVSRTAENSYFYTFVTGAGLAVLSRLIIDKAGRE